MVNLLEVPQALAGTHIESNDAAGEQVVTRAITTVVVTGRVFDRQVDNAQFRITGDGGPDTGVAGEVDALIEPGFIADFATHRNGMEGPQQFASVYVEAANVADHVLFGTGATASGVRRTHDNDIVHDKRRCRQSNVDAVEPGVFGVTQTDHQVDDAIITKVRIGNAGFCVQRHQVVAR